MSKCDHIVYCSQCQESSAVSRSLLSDAAALCQRKMEAAEARNRELEGVLRQLAEAADNVLLDIWLSDDDLRIATVAAFNMLTPAPEAGKLGSDGVIESEPYMAGSEEEEEKG